MRGQDSKKIIFDKILSTFEGSFMYNNNKELRIPMLENGERVEIKVTLTAAKDNALLDTKVIEGDKNSDFFISSVSKPNPVADVPVELSAEDQDKLEELFNKLYGNGVESI